MRRALLILLLAAAPAPAQEAPEAPEGRSIEQMLRDLLGDMEPALRQFRDAIGSLGEYHAPEMLPNGDILIRRKSPTDPALPPPEEPPERGGEPAPGGPIDL